MTQVATRESRADVHRFGNDVGAVVIGGDYVGLGIVRSLGRRGAPVCVIDDEFTISRFSRYATHAVRLADLRDPDRAAGAILEAGRRLGLEGWVLYPTRDEVVAALSRHRADLAGFFRVPTPGWHTVRWAWDKRNTYRLATRLGIPVPRTWYPRDVDELDAVSLALPVAVKPAIKEHFIYATKVKAWRADSRAELAKRFVDAAALVPPGEVMIQELIPGDGRQQYSYCALFKDGRALGSMVARRRRQHPPEFGRATTFAETVDVPEIEELSLRFLREIDYYGLVELEYKLDPRDGRFKLLDVNARAWGYHSLGFEAGVDFPHLLFLDQLGTAVPECRARTGVEWIRLVTDLPTSMLELARGRLPWRDLARSLATFRTESVFSKEDLLPGLAELATIPYLCVKRGF
jgi:predicted ATP-grasp superfamily ATP-dependent carboligase